MRKISLLMLFALAFLFNAKATNLFTGDHAVTWDTPLNLEAAKFAEAKAGDKIVVAYTGASDGMELKVIDVWQHIAGSCPLWISGDGSKELFLTPKAVADIQAHGLQIIGANFHCTSVDLVDGKAELQNETTIWTGYFWADEWSTMELYLDGEAIDWSQYKEMVIYHQANRSNFFVSVLSQFDREGAKVPEGAIAKYDDKIVVDLRQVDMNAVIAAAEDWAKNTLKFQFNKESGDAFNITDITLVKETRIFYGNKHVSWEDGGLQIAADKFAEAKAGDKIVVRYTGATDGIEFKVMNANFDHLAGSREGLTIGGDGSLEHFMTPKAVEELKAHGLELIGANFTVTEVELMDGKASLPEGVNVWTGYFWADDWNTMYLYWNGYRYVDFDDVRAIRFYHQANRSDFVLNVRDNWAGDGGVEIANIGAMTAGEGYMELPLTDYMREKIADSEHLLVQFNKESGDPFNVTDIVLVMEEPYTRTVTNGNYGTICLPRASSDIEGATMYRIVGGNASEGITIEEVASMEAGKPYIFQASADQLTVTMTGARADVQTANGLVGNLGATAMDVPTDAYVLKNNLLYLVNSAVTIAPNRAYINMSAITSIAPAPGRIRRVIAVENQATGVESLQPSAFSLKKVLMNGQLFILRDGQLYNVTGVRVQ
jgi:hypothetical protein